MANPLMDVLAEFEEGGLVAYLLNSSEETVDGPVPMVRDGDGYRLARSLRMNVPNQVAVSVAVYSRVGRLWDFGLGLDGVRFGELCNFEPLVFHPFEIPES